MTDAGLSVVVPVRGRVPQLRALLDSLRVAVRHCPEPVEVVVVDDSGRVDAEAHRAACTEHGATYLRGPRYVGAKRNLGVRSAAYDLLLFIDSDCLATPDLLARHVKTLRGAPDRVGGVAGPTYVQGADTLVFRVMRRSPLLNAAFEWPRECHRVAWATTCNLALRRDVFEAVGGFADRPLTVVGGEDVDLGIRLTEAGWEIACDPDAVVAHDKGSTDSLARVCRRLVTYGRSGQWLAEVHPRRRRFKLNRIGAVGVTALAAAAVAALPVGRAGPRRWGRGFASAAAAAALLLAQDTQDRLDPDDRSPAAIAEAVLCAGLDWSFDLGELLAALQLGHPSRVFTGFGWTDDPAFVWKKSPPTQPYGR